jgi:hypothetical protein
MNTYPVANKIDEDNTIKQILRNNQYEEQIHIETINKNQK